MRISDWSSDVCSSDLPALEAAGLQDDVVAADLRQRAREAAVVARELEVAPRGVGTVLREDRVEAAEVAGGQRVPFHPVAAGLHQATLVVPRVDLGDPPHAGAREARPAEPSRLPAAAPTHRAHPQHPPAPAPLPRPAGTD